MMTRFILALCALGVGPGNLAAHETWLAPARFAAAPATPIEFSLTSGMKFPVLEYAVKPVRLAQARLRVGGHEEYLAAPSRGSSALHFQQTFAHPGLVTAWVVLAPKALELTEAKVTEYFAEIDAPASVRTHWASLRGQHQWRETYTKCAKTFVAIGNTTSDDSWQKPAGLPLEIITLANPTTYKAGVTAELILLENGRPLPDIAIGLMTEDAGQRIFATTDKEGHAAFQLRRAGRILLFAVHLQWHDGEWHSNFTTLTLKVQRTKGQ